MGFMTDDEIVKSMFPEDDLSSPEDGEYEDYPLEPLIESEDEDEDEYDDEDDEVQV